MSDVQPIVRALISVYDKTGLNDLVHGLHDAGVEIVSTGSTAQQIARLGIPVIPVHDVTGFAEAFDGRVKTLHPNIHGGLLADVRKPEHRAQLQELDIKPFQLVVVNLYPFAQTVASGGDIEECVEQIDIGGPAMVRASAKNHANVAVVVNPDTYDNVLTAVKSGGFTHKQRVALAAQAFRHVAQYDVEVATWLGNVELEDDGDFPAWVAAVWERADVLRYGENPHQKAALYVATHSQPGIAQAEQLHGKEMSYNNYVDAQAAYRAAYDFEKPAVAIIKHENPCGIAVASDITTAYLAAHQTDPVSAFGGVIAANREVTYEMALAIAEVFAEVVVAPSYSAEALHVLQAKPNVRLLVAQPPEIREVTQMRPISGGMLLQSADYFQSEGDDYKNWTLVSGQPADAATMADLDFAWRACRSVKSNAIVLAANEAAVGIGMGQVNRVDSARLAVSRAGDRARNSVVASDAFFPFADGLEILIAAGVRAIVQPGGSVRDDEVFEAAVAAGVTMYVTGTRHFYH
ncbi:MAG: bifunctional phosphoribosylaminoimidazolecarboxamide formyltransferase/IMP cyclohydrolase [Actinobacteria bacterium]|uniref:Unannotated protein n=1 Tax=freshwater metagenome TaxID=449393 RepID=A0A6J5Z134_9ZZZZ|nr:bifunctional phosphoribosylaminoimidazolecarboxamide formyltransferase/IMP cyclohydrolase [Actinomycetota bacterium]